MNDISPDSGHHFLGSEIENAEADNAYFHVIPVPMERSVSYGVGTANAPDAIIEASLQLETWDNYSDPSIDGIHTQAEVNCDGDIEAVIDNIALATESAIDVDAIPVVIGGEHMATYGVIQGLLDAGIDDIGIVQIDAHADLRDAYEDDPYSHASVMRRCVDLEVPLFQLGVRAYCEEEIEAREHYGVDYIDADILVPDNITEISLPEDFPDNIFFTLDIDGMDPSVFPSTGTPVPGGLGWYQTLSLFKSAAEQRTIIGFDLMEYSPIDGFHSYDFAAAMLLYKMMGITHRSFESYD